MPFDENEPLFTDEDPWYRNTPLTSSVAPPSLARLPRVIRNPQGRDNHSGGKQSYQQRPPPALVRQTQQEIQKPAVDLMARQLSVISNTHGPGFVDHLSSPNWSRMMSERDDMRGRRVDGRLCDPKLLQTITSVKTSLSSSSPAQIARVCDEMDPYAAVLQSSGLRNASAVTLGHLDYLLQPVREYINAGRPLRYVDLGSAGCGYSHYIRWRVARQTDSSGTCGWYFASGALDSSAGASDGDNKLDLFEASGSILDPASIEAFVKRVRGTTDDGQNGVDLVVAELGSENSDSFDAETQQYGYTIAQTVIALRVLRKGGTFVFKAVEATTPLSAELLFLIHTCFERVAIVRSFVSRPTTSERFVVCNHLIADPSWVAAHLLSALTKMNANQLKPSHLVSWTRVSGEKQFIEQLLHSNMTIGNIQLQALNAVVARLGKQQSKDGSGYSGYQIQVANMCLKHWDLPAATK
ncbi:hypothetical protein COEREDRAFT_88877 [Coemansia reversa NRRL 1564]|uniref:Cap-specific mRNA (nucleoside-2'-O-)-methyltransferase 1 n=1 Tax=Coemansia reversa (strain ATCC 12441 / NRRL 1564) TaxID=763665 RepID=A0A2G5B5B6_COERN|nr:hypothetical protein COEREDRAFT_88877 [Coemansia reversa NRRL 1564]|eukprot:PIA14208.1 hypothetical protein COEREDRAFT_88877 [Coemansia reversa NRRL 1564]